MKEPVLCFGEALWDVLPGGIFLGGAPLNVAYHLGRLGAAAVPVTAVGRDFLGGEIVRRVREWGLDSRGIGRTALPTGTVTALLDREGAARYRFPARVAWDRIAVPDVLLRRAAGAAAIVSGSLALRQAPNRRALARLREAAPGALRVCDLNLRPPFVTPAALAAARERAELLKVNGEELAFLDGDAAYRSPEEIAAAAGRRAERDGLRGLCVTAGAHGAGLWWEGEWTWEPGRPVAVRDTVGAGDAFLAALLHGLLFLRLGRAAALARACRLGEYVASRDGATPPHDLAL